MKPVLVAVNEQGRRIGQGHPRAVLLDSEVDQVMELIEGGFSYSQVAEKMCVSKSCVAHLATGRRRAQTAERFVELPSPDAPSVRRDPCKRGPKKAASTPPGRAAVPLEEIFKGWR